jgi:hypothetical protein
MGSGPLFSVWFRDPPFAVAPLAPWRVDFAARFGKAATVKGPACALSSISQWGMIGPERADRGLKTAKRCRLLTRAKTLMGRNAGKVRLYWREHGPSLTSNRIFGGPIDICPQGQYLLLNINAEAIVMGPGLTSCKPANINAGLSFKFDPTYSEI